MSAYLWDRGGAPNPEIADLERALAPLRYERPLDRRRLAQPSPRPYALIAASVLVGLFAWQLDRGLPNEPGAWTIAGSTGATRLHAGERLRTGNSSPITIEDGDVGEVRLEPNSELSIVESRAGRHRMALQRGQLHALIWAPPAQFVVDTPSARVVDLGCQYTLSVNAAGNGFLAVETGWVAFQFARHESFIPAGAACRTTRRTGPGIPFFQDASAGFVEALERFEVTGDGVALSGALSGARPKDAVSLWHLLSRVSPTDGQRVFQRFAQLVPLPPAVTAERVAAGDPATLDLCWNALQLEDAEWWRGWERKWRTE